MVASTRGQEDREVIMIHRGRALRGLAVVFAFTWVFVSSGFGQPPSSADMRALQAEALQILQGLIRIDTSNPPGRETEAAKYLQTVLAKEGIEAQIFESAPGRGNLIARIKGAGAKRPLLLLGHTDVVGVEREHWTFDPFAAEVRNGRIYGRGVADMKALVAAEAALMVWIKRFKLPLTRDLIFLAVADEESTGKFGIQFMIENHWALFGDAEYSFNEGGRGRPVLRDGKVQLVGVQTTEKRPYNLHLIAHGRSGHASMEMPDNAIYALAEALQKLKTYEPPVRLNATTRRNLELTARLNGTTLAALLRRGAKRGADADGEGEAPEAGAEMGLYATLHDTISPTILQGGFRSNVIPATAEVNLNCRLLPDTAVEAFVAQLKQVINNPSIEIKYRPESRPAGASPYDTEAFRAIQRVVHKMYGPDVPLAPTMGTGATDSAFLRAQGMISYGIAPYPDDHPSHAHGNDESLGLEAFYSGVRFLHDVVAALGQSTP